MKKTYSITLLALLIFTGCGGGNTKTGEKTLSTAKLDALSTGITYECGSQKAALADDGSFIFEKGEPCIFKDGETVIKTLPADQLKENKTYEETTSNLRELLNNNTYYAITADSPSITKLTFSTTDEGVLQATVTYNNQQITAPVTINDNTLSVKTLYANEINFVSDKGDYLLFGQDNRLFKDKENAQQYIKSLQTTTPLASTTTPLASTTTPPASTTTPPASTTTPPASTTTPPASTTTPPTNTTTLENLLIGHTYYSVQPHDSRIVTLTFSPTKNTNGTVPVTASLGGFVMSTSISISNNSFDVPGYGTLTFINNQGDYLLFDANRRMYVSNSGAQAFVNANK